MYGLAMWMEWVCEHREHRRDTYDARERMREVEMRIPGRRRRRFMWEAVRERSGVGVRFPVRRIWMEVEVGRVLARAVAMAR